ncbi:MAG: B12-binding domain-containing radical SAM protein, partial [Candidatus Omnitrophica bacterium]|nr:B12-binding domain-containing radical SAM protein [Candidatus Omnitrophota bacterium]
MKILLIRPHSIEDINTRLPESLNKRRGVLPPLGISYIASVLEKAGHVVKILDVVALNLITDEIRQFIYEFKPEITGITTMTSILFGALESAKIAKEAGSITVLGGPQLSIYPKETLSYSYVDYGINGEGEYVMLELINALEKNISPGNIKGLIYKMNNDIHVNDPVIVEDIDSLPFPAYHLLPMQKYHSIIGLHPVGRMISTRGCPHKCSFCFKQPSDKRFRWRSSKNVVDEMEYLVQKYKVREIMFHDDVMTLRRSHIVGICEEILSRNFKVKWETPTRVDYVDKELLKLMHKAGCIRLRYGVESGDEKILELMNKKIDLKRVKEVFKWTEEAGIETFGYFMIGYAHETEATIRKTINFALELNPDFVMFTAVTPLPQTPLYDLAKREGLITTDYWREFTLGNRRDQRIPYFFP